MYLLGYDIGSSSIKAALVEAKTGNVIASAQHPETEMEIMAEQTGWAEQQPELWWNHLIDATKRLLDKASVSLDDIEAIGLAYQMHGLVLIDENNEALRPAIIWCDSRAVAIGGQAFSELGKARCLSSMLNSPGNFTASKLKWVQDNEPELYSKIHKVLLPGDYINMCLTGEINTTISGLSEGVFWDFEKGEVSSELMNYYGFDHDVIPEIKDTFSVQGKLLASVAKTLGLAEGTPVSYRSGDQPNNAMSLGVIRPGEIAATGGTSGVVYGVVDKPKFDPKSRVNCFAHVNYKVDSPSIGILLCINGAGIQYSWMKKMLASDEMSYDEIEIFAASAPINSDELRIMPFGNGAERMLENRNLGSSMINLQFNRHSQAHLYRAALEGISYSFVYGIEIMKAMGMDIHVMKVGNDNLFQSKIFSTTIASILDCEIQMVETNGAAGAAKGAGFGIGIYGSLSEAVGNLDIVHTYRAEQNHEIYKAGYALWKSDLSKLLN